MVIIKKHGKKTLKEYRWEHVVCPSCGCVFSCSQEDTESVISSNMRYAFCWINCPDCDYRIDLKENDCIIEETEIYYGKENQ